MGKLLPTILDTKYENILKEERSLAKDISSAIIKLRPLSAWDVTIPLVFIIKFIKHKRTKEIFALNFLFTKRLALEAARDMVGKEQTKEEAMAQIKEKTGEILSSDEKGIYSQKIRNKQMREIDLLIDHYVKLLQSPAKDYKTMMQNTYQTWQQYNAFLTELKRAEHDVNKAAQQTVGAVAASDVAFKMEKSAERMREVRAGEIFVFNPTTRFQ